MRVSIIILYMINHVFRIIGLTWWNKKIRSLVGTEKRSATHPSDVSASRVSSSPLVTGITDTNKRLNTMRVTSSLLLMVGVYTFETEVWQCIDWGNIEVKRDFRRTGMTTDLLR